MQVKLYLSTLDYPYPSVPTMAAVMHRQLFLPEFTTETGTVQNVSSVDFWWNPVDEKEPASSYEYCLIISKRQRHRDNCLISISGEKDFPQSSSDQIKLSGNTFTRSIDNQQAYETEWWQRAAKRLLQETLYREFTDNVIHFNCMNQSAVRIQSLPSQINYYADVFVKDWRTGLSSKYWTSNFSLRALEVKKKPKAEQNHLLHDNLFTGIFLESKNKFTKKLIYKLPTQDVNTGKVYIFAQLCNGIGPVQFYIRKKDLDSVNSKNNLETSLIFFEELSETKTFEVSVEQLLNQTIHLEFELSNVDMEQPRSLVLLATNDLLKFPFPRMPADKTVRVSVGSLGGIVTNNFVFY